MLLKRKYYRVVSYRIKRDTNRKVKQLSYCIEKRSPSNEVLTAKQKHLINLVWKIHEEVKRELFPTKAKLYDHLKAKSRLLIEIDFNLGTLHYTST